MIITRVLLSPILLFSILLTVIGQQPAPRPASTPPPTAAAQQQNLPPSETQDVVRITANLVQVDVVVTKDGKPVTDLSAEDFEIFQDGRPQTITNFSYVSNVPESAPAKAASARSSDKNAPPVKPAIIRPQDPRRTIALVVDDLGISFESMEAMKKQLRKFVAELPPNDLVAITRTGGEVGGIQQFTNNQRLLQSAIERLRWNPCSRAGLHVFPRLGSMSDGNTNYALCSQGNMRGSLAALQFIVRGLRELPGRKSVIVLSDVLPVQHQEPNPATGGFWQDDFTAYEQRTGRISNPTGDQVNADPSNYLAGLQTVAELAIRGSIVIYAVDTRGLQVTGLSAADQTVRGSLQAVQAEANAVHGSRSRLLEVNRQGSELIAKQTGGFLVYNSNSLGLQRVMEDQRGYYLIGFRPHEETFDRNFHHLKARVKRKGLTVRARVGFYGVTEEEARPKQLTAQDQITKALLSPFGANDLTVKLTTFFVDQAGQGPLLRSFLFLETRNLTFKEEADGWRVASFDFQSVLFGENGKIIAGKSQTGGFRMRGDQYDQAQREGILYSFDTPANGYGPFQFRVAVRDANSSRIGAAGQFVEIPDLRSGRLALSGIVVREETTGGNVEASRQPSSKNDEQGVNIGPALRRFRQGATLVFVYAVYNARTGNTAPAQLTTQTRIFRDGKPIFSGDPTLLSLADQQDPKRLTSSSRIQIDAKMPPGEYIMQIIVNDPAHKEKTRVASQWIDFEVIK